MLWITAILTFLFGIVGVANAEMIASRDNQGGGKIVLTNEPCVAKGETYKGLSRAYGYIHSGAMQEGCFRLEGETIVLAWNNGDFTSTTSRYGVNTFTMAKKFSKVTTTGK
jgi:hypothetical protein